MNVCLMLCSCGDTPVARRISSVATFPRAIFPPVTATYARFQRNIQDECKASQENSDLNLSQIQITYNGSIVANFKVQGHSENGLRHN